MFITVRLEAVSRLASTLGFAEKGTRPLSIRAFPGGLTSHAAGCIRQRGEAFVSDFSTTVLANAVSTLGHPVARVLGLLAIPIENLPDGLAVRPLTQNLREVGFSETLAHGDSVSPGAAVKTPMRPSSGRLSRLKQCQGLTRLDGFGYAAAAQKGSANRPN